MYQAWPRISADAGAAHAYARVTKTRTLISWRRRRHFSAEVVTAALPELERFRSHGIEDRDQLMQAMRAMPPRERAAVVLRYYEDLTERETAQAMGCSVGAVKGYTSRGIARLRQLLSQSADVGERDDVEA